MNTKETSLEHDLRHNPWAEDSGGKYAQVEFWSDFWCDGSDKLAKRMLATPIYDQTVAQFAGPTAYTKQGDPLKYRLTDGSLEVSSAWGDVWAKSYSTLEDILEDGFTPA